MAIRSEKAGYTKMYESSMTGNSLAGSICCGLLIQVEKAGHNKRKGRLRICK